jgi:hypothetical protein
MIVNEVLTVLNDVIMAVKRMVALVLWLKSIRGSGGPGEKSLQGALTS